MPSLYIALFTQKVLKCVYQLLYKTLGRTLFCRLCALEALSAFFLSVSVVCWFSSFTLLIAIISAGLYAVAEYAKRFCIYKNILSKILSLYIW